MRIVFALALFVVAVFFTKNIRRAYVAGATDGGSGLVRFLPVSRTGKPAGGFPEYEQRGGNPFQFAAGAFVYRSEDTRASENMS